MSWKSSICALMMICECPPSRERPSGGLPDMISDLVGVIKFFLLFFLFYLFVASLIKWSVTFSSLCDFIKAKLDRQRKA